MKNLKIKAKVLSATQILSGEVETKWEKGKRERRKSREFVKWKINVERYFLSHKMQIPNEDQLKSYFDFGNTPRDVFRVEKRRERNESVGD